MFLMKALKSDKNSIVQSQRVLRKQHDLWVTGMNTDYVFILFNLIFHSNSLDLLLMRMLRKAFSKESFVFV